jgi:hypothetical protein
VRAILNDRKTQTRRVCRDPSTCPFHPGQALWVREGFQVFSFFPGIADLGPELGERLATVPKEDSRSVAVLYRATEYDQDGPWVSALAMPRWASRLTLAVTAVRLERLQDISHEDCLREGAPFGHSDTSDEDFATYWDSINGRRHPWRSNPWVWVLDFTKDT